MVAFKGDFSATNVSQMTISDITGTKGATPAMSTDTQGVAADLVNPTTITVYDKLGRVSSTKDARDQVTTYTYEYNEFGQLVTVTLPDPDGGGKLDSPEIKQQFDFAGAVISETDANGNVTTRQYDILGRLVKLTQPDPTVGDAPVTEHEYDLANNLRFTTDPLGNTTEYQYDDRYRQVKVISADPDGAGWLTQLITESKYDDAGQLTSTIAPGDRTTTWAYDGLGRMTSVTAPDPDGKGGVEAPVTKYAYDAVGQMIGMTDPSGNSTSYGYDALGNRVLELSPDPDNGYGFEPVQANAPLVYREFDAAGQLLSVSQGQAFREIQRIYLGSKDSPEYATGGTYTLEFDGQETDPIDESYGDIGIQAALEGLSNIGYGNVQVFTIYYDYFPGENYIIVFRNELEYQDLPLIEVTNSTLFSTGGVDVSANLVQYGIADVAEVQVLNLGGATSGSYDIGGNGTSISGAFDDWGVQSNMDGLWGSGNTVVSGGSGVYTITFQGALAGQDIPEMTITYNSTDGFPSFSTTTNGSAGQSEIVELSLTGDPEQGSWYVSNSNGYSGSISWNPSAGAIESAIDGFGDYVSVTGSNPWTVTTTAHVSLGSWSASSDSFSPLARQFGAEIVTISDGQLDPGNTTTYEYDNLGRLFKATSPDPDAGGSQAAAVTKYFHDLNGNQVKVMDPLKLETTYDYDFLNRRTVSRDALGGETTFGYDDNGNMTSLTDPEDNTTEWVFDELNRVVEEENELNDSRFFYYDAAGNLIRKIDRNERVTVYEYDNLHRQIAEE